MLYHGHGLPWWLSGKDLPASVGDEGPILGWEDPLEKKMATHCNILVWKISWTEEPGRLQSMGVTKTWTQLSN